MARRPRVRGGMRSRLGCGVLLAAVRVGARRITRRRRGVCAGVREVSSLIAALRQVPPNPNLIAAPQLETDD